MAKLSIVISTFNEQKNVRACLDSAKWADEIIFVDNSSTDKTIRIAKEYTKKIYIQKNDPRKIDLQKNFGIQKASGDWIFVLDADEIISHELKDEIKTILEKEDVSGFWVPRKNIIFGKWIQHSGWYPDYQLRLFKKGKGGYEKPHYHEPMVVNGKTEKLKQHLLHFNYETIGEFFYKSIQIYALNEAEELLRKGYVFSYKDAIRLPFKEFLSRYFAREGYKDGFYGLMLSLMMAFYHFAIFAYIWEKKKFIDKEESYMEEFEEELKEAGRELNFWISKEKIEEEKDFIIKTILRIKRKLHL